MSTDELVAVRLDANSMAELSAGLEALVATVGEIDLGCQPIARLRAPGGGVAIDAGLRPDQLDLVRSSPVDEIEIVELAKGRT